MTVEDGLSLSGRAEELAVVDDVLTLSLSGSVEGPSGVSVENRCCFVLGLSLSGRVDGLSSVSVD